MKTELVFRDRGMLRKTLKCRKGLLSWQGQTGRWWLEQELTHPSLSFSSCPRRTVFLTTCTFQAPGRQTSPAEKAASTCKTRLRLGDPGLSSACSRANPCQIPTIYWLLRDSSVKQIVLVCLGGHHKIHRRGGLNTKNFFSYGFGGWKSKIEVLTGSFSSKASLFSLQMAVGPHPDGLLFTQSPL